MVFAKEFVTSHLTQVTMPDLRGFKNLVGLNPATNEKLQEFAGRINSILHDGYDETLGMN
jgi:hypothetical protein